LSITTIDAIGQLIYELGMIDSLELIIEPDSIIHYRVNFMSKGSATSAGQTASFGAEKKFVGRFLTFKTAATTAALTAASGINLKSLTIRIEKNAIVNQVLSTIQPDDIFNRMFNISGEMVLDYADRTYLDYVRDGSYKAARIDLIHPDSAGSGTTKYQFRLDLSKIDFDNFDPDFAMDDIVTQTLSFNALYDAGVNNNIINSCYLVNEVDSY